jgi:hypothetical protein
MIDKGIIHSFVGEAKDFLELQNRKISPEAYEKVLALCENLRLERVIRKLIRKSNSKKRSEHDVIRDHFAELLRAEEKKIKESPPAPKYPQYVPPSFLQRCRENIREFWSTLQFSIRVRREYRLDPRPKLEMRHYRFSKVSCTIKDSFYLAEHQRGGLLYLEGELTGPEVVRGEKVILTLNLIGHGPARGLMHFNAMLDPKRPSGPVFLCRQIRPRWT